MGGVRAVAGVVGVVLACLAAAVLALALGTPTVSGDGPLDRWRLGDDGPAQAPPEAAAEPVPVEVAEPPEPLLGVPEEVVLSMAVVIVAGALLVRSLLRARRPDDVPEPEAPEPDEHGAAVDLLAVAQAARRGLRRLDEVDGGDAGEVVVACWVELELAGSRAGSGRLPTDTPTDFAHRLRAAVPALDPTVLDELRRTYSRVRYGRRPATADDVDRARAALRQLLGALPAGARG